MHLHRSSWSARRITVVFASMAVVLAASMAHLHRTSEQVVAALELRAQHRVLGMQMASASDYLTSEARKYAQFGDPIHRENYWREVRETRRRDQVLERLKELGTPASETALLAKAKRHSDALVVIEDEAMRLTAAGELDAARKKLFLPSYETAKERIMLPIAEFQRRTAERAAREIEAAKLAERIAFGVLFVAVLGGFALAVWLASDRQKMRTHVLMADRMATVGTLAAGVAHELNNPLASIISNLEFSSLQLGALRRELTADRAARLDSVLGALQETLSGAERMARITRDLKSFSRPDRGEVKPVDVHSVLDAVVQIAGSEMGRRAVLVKDYGQLPLVMTNDIRLGQVALNLLLNAAQAIEDGSPHRNEIRVRTERCSPDRFALEVTDTGCGIPEEIKHRIFEPFFTNKPVGRGAGLGLSVCHGIVQQLGGRISVDSQVGRGTTVRVELPALAVEEATTAQPSMHDNPEAQLQPRPAE